MEHELRVREAEKEGEGRAGYGLYGGHREGRKDSLLTIPGVSIRNELLIAVANLINAEEHLVYSLSRVPEGEADLLRRLIGEIRALRSRLMRTIGYGSEGGELWCAAKHILSASYRVMEASEKATDNPSPALDPIILASESRELLEYALMIFDVQNDLRKRAEAEKGEGA
jgi:hypothetical protein